jgi:hypothetical protein
VTTTNGDVKSEQAMLAGRKDPQKKNKKNKKKKKRKRELHLEESQQRGKPTKH